MRNWSEELYIRKYVHNSFSAGSVKERVTLVSRMLAYKLIKRTAKIRK
jgi:hypothetical protein